MSSDFTAGERPESDLTARARVRDAALTQFAEHGFKGATMRGIAEAAGVSLGLVQHHFGSKDALREACDAFVVEAFRHRLTRSAADGTLGEPGFMADLYETSGPLLRYLARALVDDSPAAATVFDQLAAGAEAFLSETWPDRFPAGSTAAREAAAVMAAMHSGTVVLHGHLARRFEFDPLDRANTTRIGKAMLDLYAAMGEFATSSTAERIRESANAYDDPNGEPR
ncbi:TetR family transcriptional regulator [Glycomyces buryatensis]|uniref:TetR/AcrR family transcriptional regulator n=1 Tax=Glycomyces buryatensis TaxID=2570927 RepID=A0A4S8QBX8_9ACTN|nr:TetR family transcriptional regulator [Glycomyces buryatensis]THV42043.1 TetR/AcrR family transcriptional regulator [Glycomyces buryatensis]